MDWIDTYKLSLAGHRLMIDGVLAPWRATPNIGAAIRPEIIVLHETASRLEPPRWPHGGGAATTGTGRSAEVGTRTGSGLVRRELRFAALRPKRAAMRGGSGGEAFASIRRMR